MVELYLLKRLGSYVRPLAFIAVGLYGALLVLLEIVTFRSRPKDVFNPGKLSERVFGKLWLRIDGAVAAVELEMGVPKLVAKAYGTVLEVGPGSGNQLPRYDMSKIEQIYGVEPNVDLHDALRRNVKKHGLSDFYTIVPCGIEDWKTLGEYGIKAGTVDTVLSVQVLCSVPRPKALAKDLYRALKPGGQMLVHEHVRSRDYVSHLVQLLYNLVWPYFVGNCYMDRPTEKYLLEAGNWSTVELEMPKEEDAWMVMPHVSGRLVKQSAKGK